MTSRVIDPRSTANVRLPVDEQTDVLVIGAGPAGLAAARTAAAHGLRVVLVDENPVPAATMGDDIPLHWGQRMGGAVRNRNAMMEQMLAARPALADLVEAEVDVRLGTVVWGLYANGPSVSWLPGTVDGLSDGESSTMLACRAVIVAAGRRDMGLAFPGWQLPGVMGATAAERLAALYGALDARRAVVLGSTAEALLAALALHRAGVTVAAIVEQAAAPIAPSALVEQVSEAAIPMMTRRVIAAAAGGVAGVDAVHLASLDDAGNRSGDHGEAIACDTVVLGIAAVPVIELLDALGCRTAFLPERGGYASLVDGAQATSLPGIYAAGDCAGIWPAKSADPALAAAEGSRAADHAAAWLAGTELPAAAAAAAEPPPVSAETLSAYRLDWMRAAVVQAATEAHVCLCEEVTAREILEVRPPRYLQWQGSGRNSADLGDLLGNGPPNADQVKRLTRAGMGLCQGRRCREQVAALLALGAGTGLADVPLATYRAPVRPLPLGALPRAPGMDADWQIWFGIPGHVDPPWEIAPAPERAS